MERFFNTAGPCDPERHYMLPPEARIPEVRGLIDRESYFVVHAPRRVGKTTTFAALAASLTAEGRYAALFTTCEVGQKLVPDLDGSLDGILSVLRANAENDLPPDLRPPAPDPGQPAETRLRDLLERWAETCPRPVVLFLDEIDALYDDALLSVLRQLRSGHGGRPDHFPSSIALIGLRDVRDYRLESEPTGSRLGSASPFNIKLRSLTLRDFTVEEVAELYAQHTAATGQEWTPEAVDRAFELTRGQPWLTNALAQQATWEEAPDRAKPVDIDAVERAREAIILRRDTHLDSLIERLREPRVRRVIEPILAGRLLTPDVLDDDVQFALDLGLVRASDQGLEIANPIYREVIPRALTRVMESSLALPRPTYVRAADGALDIELLVGDFRDFWRRNAEAFLGLSPYSEAAAQLVFMAFLHKVVNGGGRVEREYAVGRGRIDLLVRWPLRAEAGAPKSDEQRIALELKVWRDSTPVGRGLPSPEEEGLDQLAAYLDRLDLDTGHLLVFDARSDAAPLPDRLDRRDVEHAGRRIVVWRL